VPIDATAETLLFAAARAQLVHEVLRPALNRGAFVISDRFADSSLAYQSAGRGLREGDVRQVQQFATSGLQPDLKILLDLPAAAALRRVHSERAMTNRLDQEELDFYDRVRHAYLALAERDPQRWRIVAADRNIDSVWRDVWETVGDLRSRPARARGRDRHCAEGAQ
jgi:dTMP kinase